MAELTLIIDNWAHKELFQYLMSLDGIFDVKINNEKYLEIYIKYDFKLLNSWMIRMEVFLFLDILKVPSLIGFDKHFKQKTLEYKIRRKDVCCEFCLKGAIDDLFLINGIEKVDYKYYDNYFERKENLEIIINYNPQVLSVSKMRQMELKLNI